jgi:hypothetical protein
MIPSGTKTHDLVARRAYEIWLAQGRPHGLDKEHWLAAEKELANGAPRARRKAPSRTANGRAKKPKL